MTVLLALYLLTRPCYVDEIHDRWATLACPDGTRPVVLARPGWVQAESSPYFAGTMVWR